MLPLIDVFMPNEAELTALAHAASLDEAIGSVRPWLRHAMIVKRGSRGSVLVTAGTISASSPGCMKSDER